MGKKTKVALTVGAASVAAWAASKAIAKPILRDSKVALDFDHPVVLANRGGFKDTPENTLAAFSKSAELGVHGFAIDIRLTKDEEIVIFHDEDTDRTTDLSGKVSEYTLQELKKADAGFSFVDKNGDHSYRGIGEQILTLREVLELFPQLFVVINLMDTPDTYEGSLMPSKLWRLLEELNTEDRVVVTSDHDDQIDRFNLYAQNRLASGAGSDEVKKAYAAFTSQFGHLYKPSADLFKLSEKLGPFPLGTKGFIQFLKKMNIPVYFQNVSGEESMLKLLNAGASGFIVDDPAHAMEIIQRYGIDG